MNISYRSNNSHNTCCIHVYIYTYFKITLNASTKTTNYQKRYICDFLFNFDMWNFFKLWKVSKRGFSDLRWTNIFPPRYSFNLIPIYYWKWTNEKDERVFLDVATPCQKPVFFQPPTKSTPAWVEPIAARLQTCWDSAFFIQYTT